MALFLFGAIQHVGIDVGAFHEPLIILAAIRGIAMSAVVAVGSVAAFLNSAALSRIGLVSNLAALAAVSSRWRSARALAPPATTISFIGSCLP
jgi:hypothetical protein